MANKANGNFRLTPQRLLIAFCHSNTVELENPEQTSGKSDVLIATLCCRRDVIFLMGGEKTLNC
jgi:hypothetical protein